MTMNSSSAAVGSIGEPMHLTSKQQLQQLQQHHHLAGKSPVAPSKALLEMVRHAAADEGTCRTESLSDCSSASGHDRHEVSAALEASPRGIITCSPPALLEDPLGESLQAADEDEDADVVSRSARSLADRDENDAAGTAPSASTSARTPQQTRDDDDDDIHSVEGMECNRRPRSTSDIHTAGEDAADAIVQEASAVASASDRRHFLLRGESEPDLSQRTQRTIMANNAATLTALPPAPFACPPMPCQKPPSRSVSCPSPRKSFVPTSILKARLSDSSCIKTGRFSWKVMPKPDIKTIHRRISEPSQHFERRESLAALDTDSSDDLGAPLLRRRSSSVSFKEVQIRHYTQTIGDNPSVSYGPPISLDWEYEENEPVQLENYEESRSPRRNMRQMILSYYQRRNVLTWQYGASEDELREAKRAAKKIKNRRAITNAFLPVMTVEAAWESAGRKAKKVFGSKKSSKNQPLEACI